MHTARSLALGAVVLLASQAARAQTAEVKTAEQVYKNIVQLKGTPADQLPAAMQFISVSLGVDCAFCHVDGKPEADDKNAKKTARSMIAMQMAINKDSFRGRTQVTCYSCHRGATNPTAVPPVLESDAAVAPRPPAPTPPTAGAPAAPTADQIVEKYIAAVGGADAIHKVTSRVLKGTILAMGSETPTDILTKAPNKRVSITHRGASNSYTAFDGTMGWMGSDTSARDMAATDSAGYALDAEFYLPTRLKELFPQLRRGRPETVNGADCEVLSGTTASHIQVRMDFAKDSGLLVRLVRLTENPLGRMPVEIDYADYRDDGAGVKIPFRLTLERPGGRFSTQIKEVQTNVPIDDAKFAKPAAK
jgi:hypothetical protein